MPRLRKADCSGPGLTRRRRGKGFEYLDEDGNRVTDPETLSRVRNLVIPPAWKDVWICPAPNGHIQAIGTDAAGRKQYMYHEDCAGGGTPRSSSTCWTSPGRSPACADAA